MAKIPAGDLLFFGALADSGCIRQRKNGSQLKPRANVLRLAPTDETAKATL